ncbi:MAG: HAMP domain-containing histidine kinase [Crocinitomicaceae bacterium]|jgi:two-component system, OmpR family, phosphate regulon sensor histidine kinase PhoR|nr:HAMP domain-containing histidine kinase [Crocinitomicaceae bacterium]MBT5402654.1 HAMP domain-containing histidine kinase [Crocinitomicaceae bacterium]MBT6030823.1 HAMP domain-containing histidine kinase [Crocinitomicaceae bacterium]MBT6515768.1 HAMP domain-containing histidine kinase [Crocinitomicaceae bacterium]
MQAGRGSLRIIYVLAVYVVLQLIWWGYHIIQLTKEVEPSESFNSRIWMIIGEGFVFILILSIGLFKLRQLQKRDDASKEKEKNFLLAVTHELKTPIASNRLALETIQTRDLTSAINQKLIVSALQSNNRLEELVNKILLSTHLSANSQESASLVFNANDSLKRIVKDNFESLDSLIEIEEKYGEECQLKMSLLEFETVISNLIQNAIKYQAKGDEILISTTVNADKLNIQLSDSGPGIPDAEKNKVFEKFYRIGDEMTRSNKGTGLGLYLVKEIMTRNQGSISIEDNKPKGAIFKVSFPIYSK